jgi:putative ABC transport system permease protein
MAVSLLAMAVAIGLAFLFLPVFNELTGQSLSFFAAENRSLISWVFLITLATGLLAGLYPAFYLSAFKPVKVLKGKLSEASGMFSLRKLLIVFQFIIATCLVFATIIIWEQLHFMTHTKPGFDQDQQLILNLNGDQARNNSLLLIRQLQKNPFFKSVSGASAALCSGDMMLYPQGKTVNEKQSIFLDFTDKNYISTFGLKLISGSNFSRAEFTNKNKLEDMEVHDIARQVIFNEQAIKVLGLDRYTSPGKYISRLHNGIVYQYKIMGVVKDYHYFSLHTAISPFGIMPANPDRFGTIIAKINGSHMEQAIKYAGRQWKEINPDTPFSYDFLDNVFKGDYLQDQRQQRLSGIFTCVAIFISCLGLLGLITYSVNQKAREIGIRKVIGASVTNVVILFTGQYLKLIVVANVIAWPLGWYLMNKWLQDFPYRVNISWWMFAVSLIVGMVTCFSTIAFKTIKAARANPVDSLRAE